MRDIWWESEGVRLFAVEDGQGPLVALLHGGMADHRSALPQVAPLASRYRIVAPDLRGSGRSICGDPLSFDRLAADLGALLDHLGAERAVVGGVSSGSGVALRFALLYPRRVAGLVLVTPVYGGADRGYTEGQKTTFAAMDGVAGRAVAEGVEVLRPLYANLPSPRREKALAMLAELDPASVVATSHFLASGAQPFASPADLASIGAPTLLVPGADTLHPAEVSDLHAAHLPDCTVVPPASGDLSAAIGTFCDRCFAGSR